MAEALRMLTTALGMLCIAFAVFFLVSLFKRRK
jgi:hypothetical protein